MNLINKKLSVTLGLFVALSSYAERGISFGQPPKDVKDMTDAELETDAVFLSDYWKPEQAPDFHISAAAVKTAKALVGLIEAGGGLYITIDSLNTQKGLYAKIKELQTLLAKENLSDDVEGLKRVAVLRTDLSQRFTKLVKGLGTSDTADLRQAMLDLAKIPKMETQAYTMAADIKSKGKPRRLLALLGLYVIIDGTGILIAEWNNLDGEFLKSGVSLIQYTARELKDISSTSAEDVAKIKERITRRLDSSRQSVNVNN